jgi:hypothetical protein
VGPVSTARISRARVSKPSQEERESAPEADRTHIGADILSNAMKPAAFSEIVVDLAIPRGVLAFAHKRGELRQLRRREPVYCVLDLGETHDGSLLTNRVEGNASSAALEFRLANAPVRLRSGRLPPGQRGDRYRGDRKAQASH